MLYFIPAWYKQNMWCENEQQWYMRRLKSGFDETIKQITLFHRNVDRPYRILVLGYSPNFRHFLHRQGMYRSANVMAWFKSQYNNLLHDDFSR